MSSVYTRALAYEVAFRFRDVGAECDAIVAICDELGGGAGRFLELACGPGDHALEMARRGWASTGLDLAGPMVARLAARAAEAGLEVGAVQGDMREISLGRRFDAIAMMMDSAAHLLTNSDFAAMLASVAEHLEPGGLCVLEMAHPSNHFGIRATTSNRWTATGEGLEVEVEWGQDGDSFSAVTEVDERRVKMRVRELATGEEELIEELVWQRRWTRGCVEAIIAAEPRLEVAAWLGSLTPRRRLDDERASWRMIPVLRSLGG